MKLVYLADMRLPTDWAHGIQIMKMCEAFAKNGAAVELVVPRRFNPLKGDPFTYYGVERVFTVKKLPCVDLTMGGANKFAFLVQKMTFFLVARLYLWFQSYDVLYTRETLAGFFFSRSVLELHAIPPRVRQFQVKLWQRAERIVTVTGGIRSILVRQGINRSDIIVAPDGVDTAMFERRTDNGQTRQELGLPPDQKIAMYTGSLYLYDWKGVDVLLAAARTLPPGIVMVIVGGTPPEVATLKKNIQSDNIIVTGRQPYTQMPRYLQAADVLLLPNTANSAHSERYTSPLKLFEYMASGRPIVASDLPSLREVLNERNALLVPPGDPQSLARGIIQTVNDREGAERRAVQARADAEGYTWQKRAEGIIRFCKK